MEPAVAAAAPWADVHKQSSLLPRARTLEHTERYEQQPYTSKNITLHSGKNKIKFQGFAVTTEYCPRAVKIFFKLLALLALSLNCWVKMTLNDEQIYINKHIFDEQISKMHFI